MSGLPQLENFFWPQCGFELTMFRSEDTCANQLRHPGTYIDYEKAKLPSAFLSGKLCFFSLLRIFLSTPLRSDHT